MPFQLGLQSQWGETEPTLAPVDGKIPEWLSGTLLRVAPAIFEVRAQYYNHWFDGLAKLHRFAILGGGVSYSSRFVRSDAYCDAKRTGRIERREFATDPCTGIFGRLAEMVRGGASADNPNVNVDRFGGEMVALTEGSPPRRFDPDTLETLGSQVPLPPNVSGQISTAHPQHDWARGISYNYQLKLGRRSSYRIFSLDSRRKVQRIGEFEVARPSYMHSIGLSERFVVLAQFPFCVNPLRLRFSGSPFIENYRWKPEQGVRFLLFDRNDGQVTIVEAEAAFGFHHVNALDDGDHVIVDIVTYEDHRIIDQFYLDRLKNGSPIAPAGKLTRYRLPMRGGRAGDPETLCSERIELPRINPAAQRMRNRFVYGSGVRTSGDFLDCITKVDVETGQSEQWHDPGCYPGEPVFVASPQARQEDAGVILCVVLDTDRGSSFLLVLDAATMVEVARADLPEIVTLGFHGNFFPH